MRDTGTSVIAERRDRRRRTKVEENELIEVHGLEAIAPRGETVGTRREPLQIPDIDEHPAAAACVPQGRRVAALDVFEVERTEPPGVDQFVERAVAGPRGHQ
jgi:hypothetical protein